MVRKSPGKVTPNRVIMLRVNSHQLTLQNKWQGCCVSEYKLFTEPSASLASFCHWEYAEASMYTLCIYVCICAPRYKLLSLYQRKQPTRRHGTSTGELYLGCTRLGSGISCFVLFCFFLNIIWEDIVVLRSQDSFLCSFVCLFLVIL